MHQSRRRRLVVAGTALLALPAARASGTGRSLSHVGFVSPTAPGRRDEAFLLGMRELGYVDGRDVRLTLRFADGKLDRFPVLVEEVVRLGVGVLVVGSTVGARAAKGATRDVPVVFAGSSDPVEGGLVKSLARPEGNLTGTSLAFGDGVAGKWVEVLRMLLPSLARCSVLWNPSNRASKRFVNEIESAGRAFGVRIDVRLVSTPGELDGALAAMAPSDTQGVIVTPSPFWVGQAAPLIRFGAERKLPIVYFVEDFVDAGGLASYGPSIAEAYRRAAAYVDRIMRGAMPGELPVEQPTRVDLVVNRKSARSLGLSIPPAVLARADRIID